MKKIQRIMLFQNCFRNYQTCNFTYMKLAKTRFSIQNSRLLNSVFFSSLQSSAQKCTNDNVKLLQKEFPEPRKILQKLINESFAVQQIPKPTITEQMIEFGKNMQIMWQVSISMTWPEKFQVEGVASKKTEAETIAYLNACQKMKEYGKLDRNNQPVLSEKNSKYGEQLRYSKSYLINVYQAVWSKKGDRDVIPKFNTSQVKGILGNENYWRCEMYVKYPEPQTFEGLGGRISEAEGIASSKALLWLQDKGIINNKNRLMHYTKEDEKKMLDYQNSPYSIYIPPEIQHIVSETLSSLKDIPDSEISAIEEADVQRSIEENSQLVNVITEKPFCELTEDEHIVRSREMFEKLTWLKENSDPDILEIKISTRSLPISSKRDEILDLIEKNQVLILSGETGCGKTTQVPQYILEHYISQMKGSLCNIVVTQPRRISAISISDRVACERGEKVGETIGHQVRLRKKLPQKPGAVLFCSTGILLRKLCTNPTLRGVSHVIIDEAHERNIQIDFLLILLKNLLQTNKDIKIIIMSATFNTQVFSTYFNNCPVIYIPGCICPVKEYYLEDFKNFRELSGREPTLNSNLVADVIHHIHTTQRNGAILCFLPGWHDIKLVEEKLLEVYPDETKIKIYPVHSRLPHEKQKLIFETPPDGIRKVILATNIAETSITVKDVCFVVNSGLHKGTNFDTERGTSSLATEWITKSNVRQRRGRAGRVQSGVCYNLFTRKTFMEMEEYPKPELLRMPLENVILDCKLYCPDVKAEDFLEKAIQPPTRTAVHLGVKSLQMSNVLDENENLTPLGKVVVNFATHPNLSVALVYASFLKCLDPVLTICAMLTHSKEPFVNTLEDRRVMKEVKQSYDNLLYSDHLALYKLYSEWEKITDESDAIEFEKKNRLDYQSLDFIKQLKKLFAGDLHDVGLISHTDAYNDFDNVCNMHSGNVPVVLAALTAAFYPNVMKLIQGEISNGRLKKDAIVYSMLKNQRAYIQKDSVASDAIELPSPWLVYFSALRMEERRLMMTPSVSCTPGINLLLFAGQNVTFDPSEDSTNEDELTLIIDDCKKLKFSCSPKEATLLLACREHLEAFFQRYLQTIEQPSSTAGEIVKLYDSTFFPALLKVLNVPHVPFVQGQHFKFKNGELLSEDL